MAKVLEKPNLVNLIIAILHPIDLEIGIIKNSLIKRFGEIDFISQPFSFSHTTYYEDEMGKNIVKTIISFNDLIKNTDMKVIKYFTLQLEDKYKINENRQFNLDPGYIDLNKLVLSTTKNRGHRISIGWGLYEEITLWYRKGKFEDLMWTYPSYKSVQVKEFLLKIRTAYKKKLKRIIENE